MQRPDIGRSAILVDSLCLERHSHGHQCMFLRHRQQIVARNRIVFVQQSHQALGLIRDRQFPLLGSSQAEESSATHGGG